MNYRNIFSLAGVFFTLVLLALPLPAHADSKTIIIQSTTSTQNSGLFDRILPAFTRDTGITARVVAVGTGQALKNGRNGDGDVLLVHAKPAEEAFVKAGHGVRRLDVMYNDFVIVGPKSDPAGISGLNDPLKALSRIAATKALFISRGDESGTHKKEKSLWQKTGLRILDKTGKWYRETGSGMGATLNIAAGMGAYTLTDRATWIAFANKRDLVIVNQGSPLLFNQYGVIMVNPKKHPHVNRKGAQAFIDWITGPKGQSAIARYRLHGKQLFFPNAKASGNS